MLTQAQDAEATRYRALHTAALTAPLDIPHIDAAARARAERNARLAAWDGVLSGLAVIVGAALLSATVAGAALVIGGIL